MVKDLKVYSPDGEVGRAAHSHFSHWIERSEVQKIPRYEDVTESTDSTVFKHGCMA